MGRFGKGYHHIALRPVAVLVKVVCTRKDRSSFRREVSALRAVADGARKHNVAEILFERENIARRTGEIGLVDEGGTPLCAAGPTDAQMRDVCRDVEVALTYVHRCGYIHGDVSMRNIVVAPTDRGVRATLVDFGHAQRHVKGKMTLQVGLQTHRSPEMLWALGYGPSTDFWSWGVTLLLMLIGGVIDDMPAVSPYAQFNKELHDMVLSAAEDATMDDATHDYRVLVATAMIRLNPNPEFRFEQDHEFV